MRQFKLPITHSYLLTFYEFYFIELFHNCVNVLILSHTCFRRTSRGSKLAPGYYTVIHTFVYVVLGLHFMTLSLTRFR